MRFLLVSLLVVFLGCAPYPYVDYYDMDEAIKNAPTKEEKEYYEKRVEAFEDLAERASLFIEDWQSCIGDASCQMHCEFRGMAPETEIRKVLKYDLRKRVRWFRRIKGTCSLFYQGYH